MLGDCQLVANGICKPIVKISATVLEQYKVITNIYDFPKHFDTLKRCCYKSKI